MRVYRWRETYQPEKPGDPPIVLYRQGSHRDRLDAFAVHCNRPDRIDWTDLT